MNEFHLLARQTVRTTRFITLLSGVLWAFLPMPWSRAVAGLTIGSAISLYSALSIARQIEIATRLALGASKRKPGIAVLSRMAMVMLGAFVVSRIHASVGMFLIGIFIYQFVLFASRFKQSKAKG